MAKHLYVPLDMGGLEVQNMRMHLVPNVGTSDLTDEGRFAYDSANHVIKYKDNTATLKTIATQEWVNTAFGSIINSLSDNYISWTRWEEIEASWTATINDIDARLNATASTANNAWSWVSANSERLEEVADKAVLGFERGVVLPKNSNLVLQSMMSGTFLGVTIINGVLYGVSGETSGPLQVESFRHSLNWTYANVNSPEYYKRKGMCIVVGHDIYQYNGTSWYVCYSGISEEELTGKQDVIADLETIRSNAADAKSWITALGKSASEVLSTLQDVSQGKDDWDAASTWVSTNGDDVLTKAGYAGSLFTAIDEYLDDYSFSNFGTFLSDVESHINDGTKHVSADDRSKWNGKQDVIPNLSDIINNAELGAEAFGWGNHATVGYDVVVPFTEVLNVGQLGASTVISAAPSAVTTDYELVFSTTKGFLFRKVTMQDGGVPKVQYYNVKATTQFYGETMASLHTYGKCVSINGSIYKFFGDKWTAQATWVLVHKGVDVSSFQQVLGWGNHANAGYALSSSLTSHVNNTTIHITAEDRSKWNGKQDAISNLDTIISNASDAKSWITALGKSASEVLSILQDVSQGKDDWDDAATWVSTNGDDVLTKAEYAKDLFTAIDETLDNYSFSNFGTFLSDVESHINDGTKHVSADDRSKWNGKQDAISNLSDIINNANLGLEAYGWGNHANAGYAKAYKVETAVAVEENDASAGGSGHVMQIVYDDMTKLSQAVTGKNWSQVELVFDTNTDTILCRCSYPGATQRFYIKSWAASGGIQQSASITKEGNLLFVKGNSSIYKYENDAWILYFSGASDDIVERIDELEELINVGDNLSTTIDTWEELKSFLAGISPSENGLNTWMLNTSAELAKRLSWNNVTFNGVKLTGDSLSFYAPTTSGTAGQVLVSNGSSNAPTWEDRARKMVFSSTTQVSATPSKNGCSWESRSYQTLLCDIASLGMHVCVNVYYMNSDGEMEEIIADVKIKNVASPGQTDENYQLRVSFASLPALYRSRIRVVVIG